jgi:hypothetical protein
LTNLFLRSALAASALFSHLACRAEEMFHPE